jgi:hypothetical protein
MAYFEVDDDDDDDDIFKSTATVIHQIHAAHRIRVR